MTKKLDVTKIIKAAIYCRVSTEEQAKGDFTSLDSQRIILSEFAKVNKWSIQKIYQDKASGKDLNRPEFKKMMADAEENIFDRILITRVDRISRNLRDFLNLSDKLDQLGISIISSTEYIDTSTMVGKTVRNMMIMFAQMEREMGNERTREKMISMIKEGLWTGGLTPLGYDLKDKKLEINKSEADLVNKIFNYYLEQPSALKVAQRLNSMGVKTKKRITRNNIERGGGKFTKSSIVQILRNDTYIGKRKYQDQLYEGKHKAIVPESLFNKVQNRLDMSKRERHVTHISNLPHTLTDILECGYCGNHMTSIYSNPRGKKYLFYRCTSRNKDSKDRCSSKDIKADEIERFVEKIIKQLVIDEKFFSAVFKRLVYNSSVGLKELQDEFSQLKSNLANKKTEITNILNAIALQPSDLAQKSLNTKLGELELNQEEIENKMNVVGTKITNQSKKTISKNELKEVFNKYIEEFESVSPQKKKRINQLLFEKIICKVDSNSGIGEIVFKVRADGEIKRNWNKLNSTEFDSSNFGKVWYPGEELNLRPTV